MPCAGEFGVLADQLAAEIAREAEANLSRGPGPGCAVARAGTDWSTFSCAASWTTLGEPATDQAGFVLHAARGLLGYYDHATAV